MEDLKVPAGQLSASFSQARQPCEGADLSIKIASEISTRSGVRSGPSCCEGGSLKADTDDLVKCTGVRPDLPLRGDGLGQVGTGVIGRREHPDSQSQALPSAQWECAS